MSKIGWAHQYSCCTGNKLSPSSPCSRIRVTDWVPGRLGHSPKHSEQTTIIQLLGPVTVLLMRSW